MIGLSDMNAFSSSETDENWGAWLTWLGEILVSLWINSGISRFGLTNVCSVSITPDWLNLTAPISMIESRSGSSPVISRSRETNVLSCMLSCWIDNCLI